MEQFDLLTDCLHVESRTFVKSVSLANLRAAQAAALGEYQSVSKRFPELTYITPTPINAQRPIFVFVAND